LARELVPVGPFGLALYDLIGGRRRSNGTRWNANDLAAELHKRRVEISPKQIREYMKDEAEPKASALVAIAELFNVDAGALWRGQIKPINLPQNGSITPRPTGGAVPDADQSQSEVQGKRQLEAVPRARKAKPRRRGLG
jgi:transcriptional regulator with XRE-family HTH domain